MAIQLGTSEQLLIIIPSEGDQDWATSFKNDFAIPISEHDHTGGGKGAKITNEALVNTSDVAAGLAPYESVNTNVIQDLAVTYDKLSTTLKSSVDQVDTNLTSIESLDNSVLDIGTRLVAAEDQLETLPVSTARILIDTTGTTSYFNFDTSELTVFNKVIYIDLDATLNIVGKTFNNCTFIIKSISTTSLATQDIKFSGCTFNYCKIETQRVRLLSYSSTFNNVDFNLNEALLINTVPSVVSSFTYCTINMVANYPIIIDTDYIGDSLSFNYTTINAPESAMTIYRTSVSDVSIVGSTFLIGVINTGSPTYNTVNQSSSLNITTRSCITVKDCLIYYDDYIKISSNSIFKSLLARNSTISTPRYVRFKDYDTSNTIVDNSYGTTTLPSFIISKSHYTDLQSLLEIEDRVDVLEASTLANDVAALESTVTTLEGNVSSLGSTINTNTSNISTNTSNISTNTSNISTNTSDISSLDSRVTTLEGIPFATELILDSAQAIADIANTTVSDKKVILTATGTLSGVNFVRCEISNGALTMSGGSLDSCHLIGMLSVTLTDTSVDKTSFDSLQGDFNFTASTANAYFRNSSIIATYSSCYFTGNNGYTATISDSIIDGYAVRLVNKVLLSYSKIKTVGATHLLPDADNNVTISYSIIKAGNVYSSSVYYTNISTSSSVFAYGGGSANFRYNSKIESGSNPFKIIEGDLSPLDFGGNLKMVMESSINLSANTEAKVMVTPTIDTEGAYDSSNEWFLYGSNFTTYNYVISATANFSAGSNVTLKLIKDDGTATTLKTFTNNSRLISVSEIYISLTGLEAFYLKAESDSACTVETNLIIKEILY